MVVATGGADLFATRARDADEDTRKEMRFRPRSAAASTSSVRASAMGAAVMTMSASSGEGQVAETLSGEAGVPMVPAALSASGIFRPLPGVHRQVTGLFFPELDQLQLEGKPTSSRVWYAAIDARPRGPFSATEMMSLAERGKIRDATLVWRPGFPQWKRVRHGDIASGEDLSWLRKVVLARKLREIDAAERAEEVAATGKLPKVQLTRSKAGGKKPTWQGGAAGLPPALPDDDVGAIEHRSHSGKHEISLPDATLREPSAWRADELPALPKGPRGTRDLAATTTRLPAPVTVAAAVLLAVATVAAVASSVLAVTDPATVVVVGADVAGDTIAVMDPIDVAVDGP